jgi:cytochrome c-type biogenesis protein CcmE
MEPQKMRRIGLLVALLIAGGTLAWISTGSLGENLVYYWSPTELQAQGSKAQGATIRLGGQVVPGSIQPGNPLRFQVSDGATTVSVETTAIPPQMFREGIGVVVEGTVAGDQVFRSSRLMVKHDNEYRAPKEGEKVDPEKLKREMEQMFAEGGQ